MSLDERPAVAFSGKDLHIVKCANCGRTIGEIKPVAGGLSRYRCHACKEWTWLMVVGEDEERG